MEQTNLWDKVASSNDNREKLWTKSRTFAGDVWFRFRHKPTSRYVRFRYIVPRYNYSSARYSCQGAKARIAGLAIILALKYKEC